VLVVAVDGVMPQTVEAINHAKQAMPMIVAINRSTRPTPIRPVRTELLRAGSGNVGGEVRCQVPPQEDQSRQRPARRPKSEPRPIGAPAEAR
jgi:hypothetical protein